VNIPSEREEELIEKSVWNETQENLENDQRTFRKTQRNKRKCWLYQNAIWVKFSYSPFYSFDVMKANLLLNNHIFHTF